MPCIGLSWRHVGASVPKWLVPLDSLLPTCLENCIQIAPKTLQGDKPQILRPENSQQRLVQRTLDVSLCLRSQSRKAVNSG